MPRTPLREPVVIRPEQHRISLDMIDRDALNVLRKLNNAGFSGYLVGGGVRDLFLGKTPKDFDIGTDARPGQIRRLFSNSRTIGRRFRLVQVFFKQGKIIEVSTLRSLSEHDLDGPEAVLAPNNTYGTVSEDAQRRDISINALFYEINQQTIIDHVGGFADLQRGIIRIIGTPEKRINRDPVRMLRVIRHAARNQFTIEERSWQAVCDNSHKLALCPASRLRDETLKDIYGGSAAAWFALAANSGLFFELFGVYRDAAAANLLWREQLTATFRTIDRLNNAAVTAGMHRQPDFLLISFILLPWAGSAFQLFNPSIKGARLFQLATAIRDALDHTVGPALGLTRSCRQEICTLLAHLPTIIAQRQNDTWPKWLKRKSYFNKCRLLYFCYLEATQDLAVPDQLFLAHRPMPTARPEEIRPPGKLSRRQGRPALADDNTGGIFGFKR
jgi:poly(A) polymerase